MHRTSACQSLRNMKVSIVILFCALIFVTAIYGLPFNNGNKVIEVLHEDDGNSDYDDRYNEHDCDNDYKSYIIDDTNDENDDDDDDEPDEDDQNDDSDDKEDDDDDSDDDNDDDDNNDDDHNDGKEDDDDDD